jgi:hypothetical protein
MSFHLRLGRYQTLYRGCYRPLWSALEALLYSKKWGFPFMRVFSVGCVFSYIERLTVLISVIFSQYSVLDLLLNTR